MRIIHLRAKEDPECKECLDNGFYYLKAPHHPAETIDCDCERGKRLKQLKEIAGRKNRTLKSEPKPADSYGVAFNCIVIDDPALSPSNSHAFFIGNTLEK